MKYLICSLVIVLLFIRCSSENETISISDLTLIPKPQFVEIKKGMLSINNESSIYSEEEFQTTSDFLIEYLETGANISLKEEIKDRASIIIEKDSLQPKEGYILIISEDNLIIKASDDAGAFYGVQTLRQLMPPELELGSGSQIKEIILSGIKIHDAPAFRYRGMHLDVGRHFFPKEFIKEYIANMAMLKMNYFHWHLTEDQGWRIEIKKYPKLTSHGAYRNKTLVGHYNDTPHQFDEVRYGGFYTQKDIKEIVDFATKHKVIIVPEIEMPGHSQAAISAYPELGCAGENVPVATKWGVFEHIYCPNKKTFAFLKDVLSEVIDLFPGEYIHIGGDEAPKKQWKECDHCQKLIKDLNLIDENGLQSYFIREIEAFVNDHGKKIIGWDEILEGGLAPNATVMSWRGTQGAVEAAKEGHDVILTPTSHAYFDYYQANFSDEPLAIGGYLPLKKVYGFDPVPEELNEEESKLVLGAQGNVWTEYMKSEDQIEYMVFPRILAMSEVLWKGASNDLEREYPDFLNRFETYMKRLDALEINYANHLYEIEGNIKKENGKAFYHLTTPAKNKEIKYSMNDSEYITYVDPIRIDKRSEINANAYKNGVQIGHEFSEIIQFHKGVTGEINILPDPHPAYSHGGKNALINGVNGSDSRYGDDEWLGFWGEDVEITIDLLKETEIRAISMRFYNANGQWIYAPKEILFSSIDHDHKKINSIVQLPQNKEQTLIPARFDFSDMKPFKTQFIKLVIPNYGVIPEGSQGAGNKAWTFIDEIIIE